MTSLWQPMRKTFTAELTVHEGERAVVANISTSALDRDGEVLLPQGCDASEFLQSPTVFFAHDYNRPVGKCVAIRRTQRELQAKTVLAQRPAGHEGEWLPDTLLALFQQGVIRGFSVGFQATESRNPTPRDLETFGRDLVRVYSKWRLLEYSVAPLPANQEALALAVSKGVLTGPTAAALFGKPDAGAEAVAQANDSGDVETAGTSDGRGGPDVAEKSGGANKARRRVVVVLLGPPGRKALDGNALGRQAARRAWARQRGRFFL